VAETVEETVEAEAATEPEEPEEPEAEEADKDYTVEDVRAIVQATSQAGKRDVVKAAMRELGVQCVSDIPPSEYAAFISKLKAA
jgi:cytochrome c556